MNKQNFKIIIVLYTYYIYMFQSFDVLSRKLKY